LAVAGPGERFPAFRARVVRLWDEGVPQANVGWQSGAMRG